MSDVSAIISSKRYCPPAWDGDIQLKPSSIFWMLWSLVPSRPPVLLLFSSMVFGSCVGPVSGSVRSCVLDENFLGSGFWGSVF